MTPLTQALTQAAEEYTKPALGPYTLLNSAEKQGFLDGGHTGMKLALNSPEVLAMRMQLRNHECAITQSFGYSKCACPRCSALAAFEKLLKEVGE